MAEEEWKPVINDEIRAWIGREGPPTTAEVTLRDLQRYATAVTVGDPDGLFFDEEYAKQTPYGGIVAPFLFFSNPFSGFTPPSQLKEDGIPAAGGSSLRPPIPLPRTMGGGIEVEYTRPIRPGDMLTQQSRIADINERQGMGGPLVFTTVETTYRDQRGETVVTVRSTSISR